jgi:enoyl-CoA hydratase
VSFVNVDIRPTADGNGVAVVTLNDPEKRNALRDEMVQELSAAFDNFESEASGVGAVVITGAGKGFCAGADVGHLLAHGSENMNAREKGLRFIYEGFLRIARSPIPTIAAVNGAAVGAGTNLALCCDVRLAGRSARFDSRFLQIGLHPGGGHLWLLDKIVGPQRAAAMALFGEILDGAEAERVGLAWRCVADEDLIDAAVVMAGRAADAPRELRARAKANLVNPSAKHTEAVDRELIDQMWSMDQPDFPERMARLRARMSTK